MKVAWILMTLACSGHTNSQCYPEIREFPSREACIEIGLLRRVQFGKDGYLKIAEQRGICLPLAGEPVAGRSGEVKRRQERFSPCYGLCKSHKALKRYNPDTDAYE